MKFTLTHEIDCDVDTFWKLFFDREMNEEMYRKALSFPSYEIVEQRDNPTELIRKVRAQPKIELPGAIQRLVGGSFSYTEEGTFDKTTKTWRWRMIPSTMADKINNQGIIRCEPGTSGKCRRISDITAEAKVFGLGGMIEGTAEKGFRSGYDDSAKFMNKWIADGRVK